MNKMQVHIHLFYVGHTYFQIAKFALHTDTDGDNELCLQKGQHDQYEDACVDVLPVTVSEIKKDVQKIDVQLIEVGVNRVSCDYFCRYAQNFVKNRKEPSSIKILNRYDKAILQNDARQLVIEKYIPHYWHIQFKASASLFIRNHGVGDDIEDPTNFDIHYNMNCELRQKLSMNVCVFATRF